MTYDEFTEGYFNFFDLALSWSEKSRHEGFLSLEKDIDSAKAAEREIFMYGMKLVMYGVDAAPIEKILSNVIKHEKDSYESLLMTIKKEAVLEIYAGTNPRMLVNLLSSYVDIPLNDPRYKKFFG